jgi:hypothetical protein
MNNDHDEDSYEMMGLSSSSKPNNSDAITKILAAGHDDDDSTYYHSIIERRRHIKPIEEYEDESVATNVPLLPYSEPMTSRRRNKRRTRVSPNNHRCRPINLIILIVLLVLGANWAATRILNGLTNTNVDEDISVTNSLYAMNQEEHTIDDIAQNADINIVDNRAFKSENERTIEKLSLTKSSEGWHTTNIRNKYESVVGERDIPNDGKKYQGDEIQGRIERLRQGIAEMREKLATNKDAINESNLEETSMLYDELNFKREERPSSPITERLILLRKRLLPLYSEPVPTKAERSNTTHPLFNMQSPQFQALHWLSNIDKSQITDEDIHLVQRYVLSVLYFATGGPPITHETDFSLKRRGGPWRNPTNFLTDNHECEWKSSIQKGEGRGGGIRRCDADKNVVELSIYNELAGTIPTELGRLSFLRTLYLGRNNLIGTIPTELGMIKPISSISLQYNQLTGEIPQDYLKRIPTLRFLQLEGNPLTGRIEMDDPLCQMRNVNKPKSENKGVLRVFSATCIPSVGVGPREMLECECCTKCFEKEKVEEI